MRRISLKVTPRKDGRVCKKIDGQYFTWPDEKTARQELIELARRRELGSKDTRTAQPPADPPLRVIANLFRAARKPHVSAGTWADYETAIDQFLAAVGKHRVASSLAPGDFAKVREKWSAKLGPWKLSNRVQSIRTMFNWAANVSRLIQRIPWYGDAFRKARKMDTRRVRREHVAAHGERKFSPAELRKILGAASGSLRAFVLLGLNGGMYAADIAQLAPADLRQEGRLTLIDNDRIKTGVRRKFILWPETLKAMGECRKGEVALFVTAYGNSWVNGETNSITLLFGRLLKSLGIKRARVNFGAFRATHVSAVGDHPDVNAARLVRGHLIEGIETHYDFPSIQRLKAVTDLARRRLLTTVLRPKRKRPKSA